jgi:hypothetical protein
MDQSTRRFIVTGLIVGLIAGAMMSSMKVGVYFAFGPAVLGLMIHMLWSGLWGDVS